jgi:hypothetical protein
MPKLKESRACAVEMLATPIASVAKTKRKTFILSSYQKNCM